MEVILTQDFDELGLEGDVVNVAKGYGRNYLIPQGIAIEATPQNRKAMELKSKKIEVRRLKVKADAETLKERMESLAISLSQKAGEEGKLYGSVTSMDIASALENQGISIDKRKIVLEKPIKTLGEFDIPVKIYPEVTANLRVTVNPEEA
ncbi:MAG: 50S ribosomal protein L9 [Desulfobacteraceae bacterium]